MQVETGIIMSRVYLYKKLYMAHSLPYMEVTN